MNRLFLIFLLSSFLGGCNPKPRPITFGTDVCAHCLMTIVDHPFAAEVVNTKGKAFKFDAIECMVMYLYEHSDKNFPLKLVVDYNEGRGWLGADTCFYLVSENLPSPMGGNLSAYKNKSSAEKMQSEREGTVYNWEELNERFAR